MDILGNHAQSRPSCLLVHLSQVLLVSADVGLTVRVLQDFYLLQRPSDVFLGYARPSTHVSQRVGLVLVLSDEVYQSLAPPRKISLLSEIRKRLLRPSNPLFDETELITEGNQELSVSFPLEEGQHEDARQIVLRFFDLSISIVTFEK